MFKFVINDDDNTKVSEEYIKSLEKKLNITFPTILKDYYLKHNGAEMKVCKFELNNIEYSVHYICALKFGSTPVEEIIALNSDDEDEYIPSECYPLAEDDINQYYWNTKDGKVYYYMIDEIEHPIVICESIEKFFEILNSSYEKVFKVEPNEEYIPDPYLTTLKGEKIKNIDVEKILKFDGKFIKTTMLILLILFILAITILIVTDTLPLLTDTGGSPISSDSALAFMFSILLLMIVALTFPIFSIIYIMNRIKTFKALRKYDIDEIKYELQQFETIKVDDLNTYLTKNYIVSNSNFLKVTRYDEIDWAYLEYKRKKISLL